MTKEIILSERLNKMTQFLHKGCFFADIGSDHAYLPIAVCQSDSTARAIAGELNEGPYQAAVEHVKQFQLESQIEVIKGDGLSVIKDRRVKQVVIAGMGGGLIRFILDSGKDKLNSVERLILQPNVDSHTIREWLSQTSYQLIDEVILTEDDHIYEILVADNTVNQKPIQYSDKELLLGPYLLKEKNQTFIKKWQNERLNYQRIINQIKQAQAPDLEKIKHYQRQISWIEEVLTDE